MQRREFLIGTLATAVVATVATPALSSVLDSLKPVELEDHCVRYSDVLWEACNISHRATTIYESHIFAHARAVKSVLDKHWLEAKTQGKNFHLYVDMWQKAERVNDTRYFPSAYAADKMSIKLPDGTYKLVKDRTKVIKHAEA